MADPLLSSLCRVCNTNPNRYRCPRCASQTCSLTCSKRHKLWSNCNGVRDPTVYKPRREILTPAGIDHDYNFISAIERGMERSDNVIEERGLFTRSDLLGLNKDQRKHRRSKSGEGSLFKALEESGVIIDRAPKVMRRSIENTTSLGKRSKCLNWRVEWITEDSIRFLGTISSRASLEQTFSSALDEHHSVKMTALEKQELKIKRRAAAKARLQAEQSQSISQEEPQSLAGPRSLSPGTEADATCYFYLHKPHTPSSRPRVLIPLDAKAPFGPQLRNQVVLEFPTVYVLSVSPENLPNTFMLEENKLSVGGSSLEKSLRDRVREIDMDAREEGEVDEEDDDDDDGDENMNVDEGELV